MITRFSRSFSARRATMLGAVLLAGTAWPALAAPKDPPAPVADTDAAPAPQSDPQAAPAEDAAIVVKGYRGSLQSSTNAKRAATGFSDSIFAEDIGKFPDTNIAESFNRVPGVTISRESTGEGLNVSIRGLGTNFTRVLLNGAPVAVASTGRVDSQNTNREVDLDIFPTELFTQITVNKSASASMVEGGAAGMVNMRSARPFDHPGFHLTYNLQGTDNTVADKWGYRGSALVSWTSGPFGILVGGAAVRNETRVNGYETIGLSNLNLTAVQCGAATGCNPTGGGNIAVPTTVPANAGNGLTTGATIDSAFLLAHNPGATISQLDNGLLPRLGRPSDESGPRTRYNLIGSLEFRPSDSFHFYVDGIYGHKKNDLKRIDMNWVGRNGSVIPLNTTYDKSDCSNGCTVQKGTYANAQFFLEYRPFIETTDFWSVNPGFEWNVGSNMKFDVQGNYTHSDFHRESPTVLVNTAASSGVTVTYDATSGDVPSITSNVDLNNPANFIWAGGRVNIQDERRRTITKGIRGNWTWGDEHLNLYVGAAYDDVQRRIRGYDNSQAWQNAVCGDRPSVFVPGPNTQPPCQGLNQTGAAPAGYPTYPAYGTGYTAGATGPVTYLGSLIPQSSLASYLMPGPAGFITVDWNKFKTASNYDAFHDAEPVGTGTNTGASAGFVREKVTGAYAEVNGDQLVAGNPLKFNIGIRYVRTQQTIGGYVGITDPRNGVDPDGAGPLPNTCPGPGNPRDGSCYPGINNFVLTANTYENWLPSANVAYSLSDHAVVRAAASRTMTRPNPNSMLPGVNFSSPSADTGTRGNPALSPYLSTNFDVGFEYYTGGEGYLGFAAFRKSLTGFTQNGTTTVPFSALAQYGITYDTLTPTQQAAINAPGRGGPTAATLTLTQQVNATGSLRVNGLEFNWVQPLDFLIGHYLGLKGFGFSANLTLIDQTGSGAAPAIAVGVAPVTYNVTAYYENHGLSVRLSNTFTRGSQQTPANQNGITAAALFSDDYSQWDLSSSVDLGEIFGNKSLPELTFDAINLTNTEQRTYFQFENATFSSYKPGTTFLVGLRGHF
jgi:TonB-dependent receptor